MADNELTDQVAAADPVAVDVNDDSPISLRKPRADDDDEPGPACLTLEATVTEDGSLVNEVSRVGPGDPTETGQVQKSYVTRGGRRRVHVSGPDHDRVRELFETNLDAAGRGSSA